MLVDICEEDRPVMNGLTVNQEAIERMGLKPCPFCGSKVHSVEITTESNSFETSVEMVVKCWCGAEVHIWATHKQEIVLDKAIELWNSRVIEPDTLEAAVKRLTKASNQLKADLIDAMAHGIKAYNAQLKRKGNKE